MVPFIIALNIVVFTMWLVFSFMGDTTFMTNHFLVSWASITEGRPWTLLTSAFSHASLLHLFLNMYVLAGFGSALEVQIGPRIFVRFYLIAGLVASLAHASVSAWVLHEPALPALGASGAISGVVMLFSFLMPQAKILIFGIIPVPALVGALLLVGLDVWGLVSQVRGSTLPIGFGAHLGGALVGLVGYLTYFRPRRSRFVQRFA